MKKNLVAVLSVLEGRLYDEVKEFWKLFEERYGAKSVQIFEHPSVTLQGGYLSNENLEVLRANFSRFAEKIKPFNVEVREIGRNDSDMIYFKVEKDEEFSAVNAIVNTFLNIFCDELIEEYLPENWNPIIPLAMNDMEEHSIERAWNFYEDVKFQYVQGIHNLYLIRFEEDGNITVLEKAKLGE